MSGTAQRILVAGELNPDAILLTEGIEAEYGQSEQLVADGALTVGASGAIVACGTSRLGMTTAYVGVVGDDAAGRFMLRELAERGIDLDGCRVDAGRRTGLSVVLSRGDDRAILTSPGAMAGLASADVTDEMLEAARHLHVSSPSLQEGLRDGLGDLMARAHDAGATTSLDPGWDPSGTWGSELEGVLEATDVFLPNAAEACRFADADDPHAALDRLADGIATVVVKLGAEGAIARRGREIARATVPEVSPADSTGAGDNLTSGFLFGLYGPTGERGPGEATLEEALRLAVACGSLSTRGIGGVEAQPTAAEAVEVARRMTSESIERNIR
jgi:sugar/nucleoside kinase (ribokinase family)